MLLIVTLLVSLGLRVARLADKNVWWDEGLAAWAARQSLPEIARWTAADVHPPLYFWMLHFWRLASGDSEFGLRFLSVVIGVLTIAGTYGLGREVGGRGVGTLTALLMGLSRFDVWWSQEMRMYALAALLAVFSFWAAIRFWDRGRLADGALYVVFTAAGLYTLYLYVSVLVVVNLAWLWVLWRSQKRMRALAQWGGAQVAVLALFAPWLGYALGRIPTWSSASPVAPGVFLEIYWTVLTTGISVNVEAYRWLTLPVLGIFLAGLGALFWRARRDWRAGRNVGMLLLGLLLPAGVVYVVSLPREAFFYAPQLAPRYLLIFAPAFHVLCAWGVSVLARGRLWMAGVALTAIVVGVACYGLGAYYPGRVMRDDYRSLATTLDAYQRPGDAVILYTDKDWPVFAYYHPGRWWGVPHAQPVTSAYAASYLTPIWSEYEGIWLVVTPYAAANDPQGEIVAWLSERAGQVVEHRSADKVLRFYARTEQRALTAHLPSAGARPSRALSIELDRALRLSGYDQPVSAYRSGDTIHLFLYWRAESDDERASAGVEVSLLDRSGQAWKRVEMALPGDPSGGNAGSQGCGGEVFCRQQVDLAIPPDAPGGTYAFAVRSLPHGEMFRFGRVLVRESGYGALSATDIHIAHPVRADFGDGIRLLGYDAGTETLEPGGVLHLTLYWQALQPVERRYKVFTHVLGPVFNAESGSFLWGQQDNEPANGTRPTSTWRTDEVIVDEYAISLHPQSPAGRYTVEIGLYDPATGERLAVVDELGQAAADHLLLANVAVEGQ
ncbi:MAG: glycosyltransferase family 39 protein [Anaerolineae bacterium]|nr:glycosyltransferase family 39 protein [Anaerolineae bacterium]